MRRLPQDSKSNIAGMTLVEVLAALLILTTLVGTVLVARARLHRLGAQSHLKTAAIGAADGLLKEWWISGEPIPVLMSGKCGERKEFQWTTVRVGALMSDVPDLDVVRLRLTSPSMGGQTMVIVDVAQIRGGSETTVIGRRDEID